MPRPSLVRCALVAPALALLGCARLSFQQPGAAGARVADAVEAGVTTLARSRANLRFAVAPAGPALVTGDWALAPTLPMGTDDRYDNPNTREDWRRRDENQLAMRRAGERPPNPLPPLLRALRLDRGRFARLAAPPDQSSTGDATTDRRLAAATGAPIGQAATPLAQELRRQIEGPAPLPLPTLAPPTACVPWPSGDRALQQNHLAACLREARDARERARFRVLIDWLGGQPVRGAARRSGLKRDCADQVIDRYRRLADPAVRTVMDPRRYLRDACYPAAQTLGGAANTARSSPQAQGR